MPARDRSPPYPGPPSYRPRPSPERYYDPTRPSGAADRHPPDQSPAHSYPYPNYREPASSAYRSYAPGQRDAIFRPTYNPATSAYPDHQSYPWLRPAPRPQPATVGGPSVSSTFAHSSSNSSSVRTPRLPRHRPRSPSPCTADQLRAQRTYRPPDATMSTDYQVRLVRPSNERESRAAMGLHLPGRPTSRRLPTCRA